MEPMSRTRVIHPAVTTKAEIETCPDLDPIAAQIMRQEGGYIAKKQQSRQFCGD
jgi:hypothetical protein